MGEDNSPRTVDDRSQSRSIERRGDVLGRASLTAETRHEKPTVRHFGAQFGKLLRVGRPDDGPHGTVTAIAFGFFRQKLHVLADVPIQGPSIGNDFLDLLAQWGNCGSADFDADGVVGISDFLDLLANWGPCP